MKSEYHLFIIWDKARYKEKQILSEINKEFHILYKINVRWSKKLFSNNLTRFYGLNLPPNSFKEEHIGTGDFLVIIVIDKKPKYNLHDTSNGSEYINSRTFLAKSKYRDLTGGGHKIHGTNTRSEFMHDFALLFGLSLEDFKKLHHPNTDKTIQYNKDLVGAKGWESISQMFGVLNLTHEYIVMRNFEILPDRYYSNKHGDIDFLVKDHDAARFILNATPVFMEPYRVHQKILIGREEVLIDLRHVGDGYNDPKWQEEMLQNKIFHNTVNVMNDIDYFYSLLYHALIHKKEIAKDYINTLRKINKKNNFIHGHINDSWFVEENAHRTLAKFLHEHQYIISQPEPSVYYNEANVEIISRYIQESALKEQLNLDTLSEYNRSDNKERRYYKAHKGSDTYFIKCSLSDYTAEFNFAELVYKNNNVNFVEPIVHQKGDTSYIVERWVEEGINLKDYIKKKTIQSKQKKLLIKDLIGIADSLWKINVSHRDIIPRNFIVTKDGRLVLIDFYWAVDTNNYKEYDYVEDNIENLRYLGEEYSMGMYQWDDSFSFVKIAQLIAQGEPLNKFPELDRIVQRVGKRVITPNPKLFQRHIENQNAQIKELQRYCSELLSEQQSLRAQTEQLNDKIDGLIKSKRYRAGAFISDTVKIPTKLARHLSKRARIFYAKLRKQ